MGLFNVGVSNEEKTKATYEEGAGIWFPLVERRKLFEVVRESS
jgi:hypothetical protein